MTEAEQLAQRQLEAYNARDIDAFCACYAETVEVWRMPATEPAIRGMAKFRETYVERFKSPNLHAKILQRIALGSKVVDQEYVVGIKDVPVEVIVVYEAEAGRIRKVWFFNP